MLQFVLNHGPNTHNVVFFNPTVSELHSFTNGIVSCLNSNPRRPRPRGQPSPHWLVTDTMTTHWRPAARTFSVLPPDDRHVLERICLDAKCVWVEDEPMNMLVSRVAFTQIQTESLWTLTLKLILWGVKNQFAFFDSSSYLALSSPVSDFITIKPWTHQTSSKWVGLPSGPQSTALMERSSASQTPFPINPNLCGGVAYALPLGPI